MILLFGKGRRSFYKGDIEYVRPFKGENGEEWLIFFPPGDPVGTAIDLRKYDWAYTIGDPHYVSWVIHWYKGEPPGWKFKKHPDCIFS